MQISIEEVSRAIQSQSVRSARPAKQVDFLVPPTPSTENPDGTIDISARTREVRRVRKLLADTPDIREDLVLKLQQQIDSGTYNIGGEDIADLVLRRAYADSLR